MNKVSGNFDETTKISIFFLYRGYEPEKIYGSGMKHISAKMYLKSRLYISPNFYFPLNSSENEANALVFGEFFYLVFITNIFDIKNTF